MVGKSICTSFTNLAEVYFRELEGKKAGEKLDTHIKYVGGSVEAACALGVADGIVDLVGEFGLDACDWLVLNMM